MAHFDRLVADLIAQECAADPPAATRLGLPGHDGELPDLSAAGVQARERAEQATVARFQALATDELTLDERLDRDLILMTMRRRAILRDWRDWQRDAESYLDPVLDGVFDLFLHRPAGQDELVRDAVARLRGVPDLLAAARANLDPELAAPLLVDRAVEHAGGAQEYLRDWLPGEAPASRALADAAGEAAGQVQAHESWLRGFRDRARGDWRLGEARYTQVLREAEGLPFSAQQLAERGEQAYEEIAAELQARALDLGAGGDWRALLDRLTADAPPTPEAMQAEYAEWTERARQFCRQRELVTFPAHERCVVTAAPPHSRAVIAVAFYVEPPPFGPGRVGHFFVPFPPAGATAERVRQRLASNSRMSIPTTAVHEAYPGHHWHLAWLGASGRRPIRQVFSSAYFIEGWALYAEQMLAEQGFFPDPVAAIGQLEARLFRAARVVVDPGLHSGAMSVSEAADYLTDRVRMAAETARAEAVRYCAWPTQAPSYLIGAMEIARLREEWVGAGGGLRAFHDRLAGSGMLPLGLVPQALPAAASG